MVKIYDQFPQSDEDRKRQINPNSRVITKGWLKASHREIDASKSIEFRIDLSNGDSGLTEYGFFQHEYTPNKLGKDTIMHNNEFPSQIQLPVVK